MTEEKFEYILSSPENSVKWVSRKIMLIIINLSLFTFCTITGRPPLWRGSAWALQVLKDVLIG